MRYFQAFITIGANNFKEVREFYRQFLGEEPSLEVPDIYSEFNLQGLRLGIFRPQEKHHSEFTDSVGSGMSLCLEVEDLEAAIALITKIGYGPPGEVIAASHGREIYAYDPAGNRLILHQSTRESRNPPN